MYLTYATSGLRAFFLPLLVLYPFLLTACGPAADTVNTVRTVQRDPGVLYDAFFYAAATPEDVRQAINGRSLSDESFTQKSFAKEGNPGTAYSAVLVFSPFSSSVKEYVTTPLEVAVRHTPYPEVIRILLEAGADPNRVNMVYNVTYGKVDPEIARVLLEHGERQDINEIMAAYAKNGNKEMVDYCLTLPGASVSAELLEAALWGKDSDLVKQLLSLDVPLPQDPREQHDLLCVALDAGNAEGYLLLVKRGMDASFSDASGYSLQGAALDGGITDEAVVRHLSETAWLGNGRGDAAVRLAARADSFENVKLLFTRGATVLHRDHYIAVRKNSPHAAQLRALLEEHGFKVSFTAQ